MYFDDAAGRLWLFLGAFFFLTPLQYLPAEPPWSISSSAPVTADVYYDHYRKHDTQKKTQGPDGFTRVLYGFYSRYISPLDGATCHYTPTCSRYTAESVEKYGALQGMIMGADRLIRCHPGQEEHHYDPPITYE